VHRLAAPALSENEDAMRNTTINDSTTFTIGSEVSCSDGDCGELRRVIVDPDARALTHLVVEAKHRRGTGHLVPISLVDSVGEQIQLRCSTAEFDALEGAEETKFLPVESGIWGYGSDQMLSLPYYRLRLEGRAMGGTGLGSEPQVTIYDRVPQGEVEVRRGQHVHATDGPVGQVRGLAVDPSDHHVTHVLLDEGHLWRKRTVAIPITAIADVGHGVWLTLTKDEVGDLPPVDLDDDGRRDPLLRDLSLLRPADQQLQRPMKSTGSRQGAR
jgi:hypothetical protein